MDRLCVISWTNLLRFKRAEAYMLAFQLNCHPTGNRHALRTACICILGMDHGDGDYHWTRIYLLLYVRRLGDFFSCASSLKVPQCEDPCEDDFS